MNPLILFPSRADRHWNIDEDFYDEFNLAQVEKLDVALVNQTALLKGDLEAALATVPPDKGLAIYRGWMLKPKQYRALYDALALRGVALINTPEEYQNCHYLPDSYPFIKDHTPRSVWFRSLEHLDIGLDIFGDGPVIVKDYVKSQKHYWNEACFIPRASDKLHAEKVVNRFVALQGDDLNEGIVLREYVPLKIVGHHPKSGMPMAAEYRIFWLSGQPILANEYWGDLAHYAAEIPWDEVKKIARQIPSHFFTMDIAFLEDGSWTIVELGDGQVSGLPSQDLARQLYVQIRTSGRIPEGKVEACPVCGVYKSHSWRCPNKTK